MSYHYHGELVVVEASLQGPGIGRMMMEELCREVDREPAPAWLETDTEDDVRFYRHYGFEVAGEATVPDARNWYMRRD